MPASTAARAMLLGALAIVGAATLPSIGSGESAGPADGRAMVDTTVAFARGGTVAITGGVGSITVEGWNQPRVRVRSTPESWRVSGSASRLTISEAGGRRPHANLHVSVPIGTRIVAGASAGEIVIRGAAGDVEVSGQNGRIRIAEAGSRVQVSAMAGDVTVQGARGRVDVSTVAGAVVLDDIRGDVTATTVSGGVTLRDLGSRLVRVRSTQGTLSYTGPVLSGARYELVTHAGDVRLAIPREASAQLSVSTWSGSVSSAFPIRLQPGVHGVGTAASKQYTFEIGSGAARITAASFAGNIIITTIGRSE